MLRGGQLHEAASEVLVGARTHLDGITRACVVPGSQIAWDDCCGQLAVAVQRTYLSENFPAEYGGAQGPATGAASPCGPAWVVVHVAVQVLRCAPTIDEGGQPPSCAALTAAAEQILDDAAKLRRGVACHLADLVDSDQIIDYRLAGQVLVGPEGGCAGSTLEVLVALDNACECA